MNEYLHIQIIQNVVLCFSSVVFYISVWHELTNTILDPHKHIYSEKKRRNSTHRTCQAVHYNNKHEIRIYGLLADLCVELLLKWVRPFLLIPQQSAVTGEYLMELCVLSILAERNNVDALPGPHHCLSDSPLFCFLRRSSSMNIFQCWTKDMWRFCLLPFLASTQLQILRATHRIRKPEC